MYELRCTNSKCPRALQGKTPRRICRIYSDSMLEVREDRAVIKVESVVPGTVIVNCPRCDAYYRIDRNDGGRFVLTAI